MKKKLLYWPPPAGFTTNRLTGPRIDIEGVAMMSSQYTFNLFETQNLFNS